MVEKKPTIPTFGNADSNAEKPAGNQPRGLFDVALALSVLAGFVLMASAFAMPRLPFTVAPLLAVMATSVVLVSAWSVLGPGKYYRRMLHATAFGLITATGLVIPILIMFGSLSSANMTSGFIQSMMRALLAAIPIAAGSQLVFWFFRGLFGWQFVIAGNGPEPSFQLRDLFLATILFAAAFGTPQVGYQLSIAQAPVQLETDTESEESKRLLRQQMVTGYMVIMVAAAFTTLLSWPIFRLMFGVKEASTGCFVSFFIGIAMFIVIAILFYGFAGAGPESDFVMIGILFMVTFYCGGLSSALLTLREKGVSLTTPRRSHQGRSPLDENESTAPESEPSNDQQSV